MGEMIHIELYNTLTISALSRTPVLKPIKDMSETVLIDNRNGQGRYTFGKTEYSFAMGDNGHQFKHYNWVLLNTTTRDSKFYSTKKEAQLILNTL